LYPTHPEQETHTDFEMESTKERIYIGGLNPPRLSARDIFRRLKSLDQIEIEDNDNINDNDGDSSDDEYGSTATPICTLPPYRDTIPIRRSLSFPSSTTT